MKKERLYKESAQRREILKVLQGTKSHPTADWIYLQVKKKFPKLSLGTVYRNLKILKEQGSIQELSFGSTFDHFDGNPSPHYHLICQKCGKIFDIEMPVDKELNRKAEQASPFKVDYHRLEFFGWCQNCQKERR